MAPKQFDTALNLFVEELHRNLSRLGFKIRQDVVGRICAIAYYASLIREESRFVRGSLTYANPKTAGSDLPPCVRADYPQYTRFELPQELTSHRFAKLSRAIDRWSGSIAVYGRTPARLQIWGMVDQIVQYNVRMHRETRGGFDPPGVFTLAIDGPGELSAYRGSLFLGALHHDTVIVEEPEALTAVAVLAQIKRHIAPYVQQIDRVLGDGVTKAELTDQILFEWADAVARLCISLRRAGTGGSFLLSPLPRWNDLRIGTAVPYRRLGEAVILSVLETEYRRKLESMLGDLGDTCSNELWWELEFADADEEDRRSELTACAKIVSAMASYDGAVVLDPLLNVHSFGTKIEKISATADVFEGSSIRSAKSKGRRVDLAGFGTRHHSMLSYCSRDKDAIGVIVSQDGQVKIATTYFGKVVFWQNVSLLSHSQDVDVQAEYERRRRQSNRRRPDAIKRGYTDLPKTLAELELAGGIKRRNADPEDGSH